MAPYHAHDNQGVPKLRSPSTKEMLSVNKDSHNVTKAAATGAPPQRRDWQTGAPASAPTIRVIHIFAPKVIKTDMANFRSTVQKLTGRSIKKSSSQRRGKSAAVTPVHPTPSPGAAGAFSALWDQESSNTEVLQRLVGDACGTESVVRSQSVESTYSLDSGSFSDESNGSAAETDQYPSPADSFCFFVPQRDAAYSLGEIPAPFFAAEMHPCYNMAPSFGSHASGAGHGEVGVAEHELGFQLPTSHVLDGDLQSMGGFDVDNLGSGLGSPLPLSDNPFPLLGSGSSGGLYDLLSVQQHCRLSVQQPFQGGSFFELI